MPRCGVTLLRKLFRTSAADRRLLAAALLAVPLVRIALWTVPFRVVHRAVAALTRRYRGRSPRAGTSPQRITWAVSAVAARVPRASCLTQALAGTLLLVRDGHPATLRVGVAKDESGRLRAHAWLESGGVTILGEPAPGAFTALPPLALS